ncbi:MAG TPA: YopX family protein [Paenisporosarcina sp.]|nr:YopX family protein [Paenisporosarcina sp.]
MRVIKFRAWDYNNEKVIPWENIRIEKDENEINLSVVVFDGSVGDHYDDFPIMQYTGLEDKNNKEIYEGDIISYWWSRRNKGAVYFENGCYMVDGYLLKDCPDDTEVIGNIYENLELLNA